MIEVGRLVQCWRYPVKSMAGERLTTAKVDQRGILGDRAWAVLDALNSEISGGKNFPELMLCAARYVREPDNQDDLEKPEILLPDGSLYLPDDIWIDSHLSALLQHPVVLNARPPRSDQAYYRRRSPLGPAELKHALGIPPSEPLPDFSQFPLRMLMELAAYTAPPGTHFDAAPIHFLTTATLAALYAVDSTLDGDVRRLRPNLLIETGPEWEGAAEQQWLGGTLHIGDTVLDLTSPTSRCSMPAQAQPGLPKQPGILRAMAAPGIGRILGMYANVRTAGMVREGDIVWYEPKAKRWWDRPLTAVSRKITGAVINAAMRKSIRALGSPAPAGLGNFSRFRVAQRVAETVEIVSLHLEPADDTARVYPFLPGQHIPLALENGDGEAPTVRRYSLSNASHGNAYRISVRHCPAPSMPQRLHEQIKEGDTVWLRWPAGRFHVIPDANTPLLLVSMGIGITPMLAILHALAAIDSTRPVTLLHGARNSALMGFHAELAALSARLPQLRIVRCYSHGGDCEYAGRVKPALTLKLAGDAEPDIYLCGTPEFSVALSDALAQAGVPPSRIHAEFFGPRPASKDACGEQVQHQVRFARSGVETQWTGNGSLLELAESAGLKPSSGCRYGVCQACATPLLSGEVTHDEPASEMAEGTVLLCCARPSGPVVIDL